MDKNPRTVVSLWEKGGNRADERTHARLDCLSSVLVFPRPSTWNYLEEAWGTETWGYPQPKTPLAHAVFGPWKGPCLPSLSFTTTQ